MSLHRIVRTKRSSDVISRGAAFDAAAGMAVEASPDQTRGAAFEAQSLFASEKGEIQARGAAGEAWGQVAGGSTPIQGRAAEFGVHGEFSGLVGLGTVVARGATFDTALLFACEGPQRLYTFGAAFETEAGLVFGGVPYVPPGPPPPPAAGEAFPVGWQGGKKRRRKGRASELRDEWREDAAESRRKIFETIEEEMEALARGEDLEEEAETEVAVTTVDTTARAVEAPAQEAEALPLGKPKTEEDEDDALLLL